MFLTKYAGTFVGPVAVLLGLLMDGIFRLLNLVGMPNVGFSIILFTLIVHLCLLPLTIKQQKFSKLSARMNPELQAISAKYKDKRDNESMLKMREETNAVYAKYGTSQSGTCLPLLIQMPILFGLYRVINSIPAYVKPVKDVYIDLVTKLSNVSGAAEYFSNAEYFKQSILFSKQFKNEAFVQGSEYMQNTFIDVLNMASSSEWKALADKFPDLSGEINEVYAQISSFNNFLGLNIGNAPLDTIKESFASGSYLIAIAAILVPVLVAFTQWFNTQLMPQPSAADLKNNPMMASMRTMNITMPIIFGVMCFSWPTGLGIYWLAGNVIRCIQQVVINKYFDKLDVDELIENNVKKYEEKQQKMIEKANEVSSNTVMSKASKNTKNIEFDYRNYTYSTSVSQDENLSKKKKKNTVTNIAAKANKLNTTYENE